MDISTVAVESPIRCCLKADGCSDPRKDHISTKEVLTLASSCNSSAGHLNSKKQVSGPTKSSIQRNQIKLHQVEARHTESNLVFSLDNPWNHLVFQQNHRFQQVETLTADFSDPQKILVPSEVFRMASNIKKSGVGLNPDTPGGREDSLPVSIVAHSAERSQAFRSICNTNLEQLSAAQLLELMTRDKTTAIAFQKYIYTIWKRGFSNVRSAVISNLEYLATHPLGNYVLQVLLLRDVKIRSKIEEFCTVNFFTWADHEFASRLMQCLVEVSPSFQLFTSSALARNPKGCGEHISRVFLVLALIRSCVDQNWLAFLREYVLKHYKAALENRNMRRLIASLCEVSSFEFLDQILAKMHKIINPDRMIREKSMASIFQTMIARSHKTSISEFRHVLKYRFESLMKSGFFTNLWRKFSSMNTSNYENLQKWTRNALLRTDIDKLLQYSKAEDLHGLVAWLEMSNKSGTYFSDHCLTSSRSDWLVGCIKQHLDPSRPVVI